jgi:anti-sigma regulatory factor (Ser/Thr protein kinase)
MGSEPNGTLRRPGQGSGPNGPALLEQDFDRGSLYMLRAAVAAHAADAGLSGPRVYDVVLAVHELAANAVRHGAGRGRLRLRADGAFLCCQVSDDGPARSGDQLKAEIRRLFEAHRGTYGSPRITADLQEAGWRVSKNTVAGPDGRDGPGRPPRQEAQGHDPAGQGPVEGAGPGQAGLPGPAAQHQVVRRRHRYRHR